MMNDFSRDGRVHCVVQRSLMNKPESVEVQVLCLLVLAPTEHKLQVLLSGLRGRTEGMRHRQPTCRQGTRLEVYRQQAH